MKQVVVFMSIVRVARNFYCRLQGVTLKINEENKCLVARIIHGGMIHRQGLLTHFVIQKMPATFASFLNFETSYLCSFVLHYMT